MSNPSLTKHHAALSIEDLFEQPKQNHSWLLTYLDVFVLIIMLVVTLLTLSDFKTKKKEPKQPTKISTLTKTSPHKLNTKKATVVSVASLNTKTVEKTKILKKPLEKKINVANNKDIKPVKISETIPQKTDTIKAIPDIVKKEDIQIDNQQNIVRKIASKNTPTHKDTTRPVQVQQEEIEVSKIEIEPSKQIQATKEPAEKNSLQKQLSSTVAELGLTDSVKMKITLGYAQLEIQDKILFKSSEANLLSAGNELLKKLAPLLDQSLGLIYIEGHTDNRPIKTKQFPSNWELGATRATSVLHYLVSQNLNSSRLRAITFADTKPIADNSTKEGRERNRRVSIVIKVSDKIE